MNNLNNPTQELFQLEKALYGDVTAMLEAYKKRPERSTKRAIIREMFAYVEAIIFLLGQAAAHQDVEHDLSLLSDGEREVLRPERYELTGAGAKLRANKPSLTDALRFSFKMFGKVHELGFELDTKCPEWNKLLSTQRMRDRLAHPKSLSAIDVSDEELSVATEAFEWFRMNFFQLIIKSIESMDSRNERVRKEMEARQEEIRKQRTSEADVRSALVRRLLAIGTKKEDA